MPADRVEAQSGPGVKRRKAGGLEKSQKIPMKQKEDKFKEKRSSGGDLKNACERKKKKWRD
jgi:hypothetical protein